MKPNESNLTRSHPCPVCHHKGVSMSSAWRTKFSVTGSSTELPAIDGRPQYMCNSCGNTWTCRRRGKGYKDRKISLAARRAFSEMSKPIKRKVGKKPTRGEKK